MEHVACNVMYVDRSVSRDRLVVAGEQNNNRDAAQGEPAHIAENVKLLLDVFGEGTRILPRPAMIFSLSLQSVPDGLADWSDIVHLCSTGGACLTQWLSLQETSMGALKPTLFLLDTPYQDCIRERGRSRSPSSLSLIGDDTENQEEEIYGLALMRRINSESYIRNASKLIITIPLITSLSADRRAGETGAANDAGVEFAVGNLHLNSDDDRRAANTRMLRRCLDLGATDVMANPINPKCVTSLEVLAYRAHLDAARDQKALIEIRRGRKRSWVGISDEKPFSYLREAMVSKLMGRICRIGSETEDVLCSVKLSISTEKQAEVTSAVGQWHFCAHDFTDDELVVASLLMFKHALSMPELEPWRIPTGTSVVTVTALLLLLPSTN